MVLINTLVLLLVLSCTNNISTSKASLIKYVRGPRTCEEDKGEAAGLIRKAVLTGDYKGISEVIQRFCGEANLARGFEFDGSEDWTRLIEEDLIYPDIISFKGLAYHSLKTGEYERLANIFLYSLHGNDLIITENENKCVCSEEFVDKDTETHFNKKNEIKSKDKSGMSTNVDDNGDSSWSFVETSNNVAKISYKDPVADGCQWTATIKMTCKEVSEEVKRKLTEEEIKIKRDGLIDTFSDEAYMQSIVDDSYFGDMVESNHYRQLLHMRELHLAAAVTNATNVHITTTSFCCNCEPARTCCKESDDCANLEHFCP